MTMPDLNFDGHNTLYASHGLHAYAAKCPPQLVRYGIRYYSTPGDMVLDPMVGSGTTLVEARLLGRQAIGYDIDPVAKLIAEVKSRPLRDAAIELAFTSLVERCKRDFAGLRSRGISRALRERATPPDFHNREYWFSTDVAAGLSVLSYHLSVASIPLRIRKFLWVAFSSIILAKTSVANARDIIHSRHHYYEHDEAPDVLLRFIGRVKTMRRQMQEFLEECGRANPTKVTVRSGDARRLGVRDESVDLIFTSPPYATALDYPRAHFLAVPWMQSILGLSLGEYLSKAPRYIGTERGRTKVPSEPGPLDTEAGLRIITHLEKESPRHAKLTRRYFGDVKRVFSEMYRVLRPTKHAIVVVCPSHIRKVEIPTHEVLTEIGRDVGFRIKRQYSRTINERRRLLPYIKKSFGNRMDTEYILIFQKT